MPQATHHSDVRFADGLLTVSANSASLNGLIREIARQTGMHVTGAVAEDRVFGTYGPAEPARVLSTLLNGTGSNLLIVGDAADRPRELILTARTGGVTPPNPNAAAQNSADDNQDDNVLDNASGPPITTPGPPRRGGPPRPQFPPNASGFQAAPGVAQPTPSALAPGAQSDVVGGPARDPAAPNGSPSSTEQPVIFPPADATNTPSTFSSTPTDSVDSTPKDTKTPQQIFEELQRLRQQQNQTPQ